MSEQAIFENVYGARASISEKAQAVERLIKKRIPSFSNVKVQYVRNGLCNGHWIVHDLKSKLKIILKEQCSTKYIEGQDFFVHLITEKPIKLRMKEVIPLGGRWKGIVRFNHSKNTLIGKNLIIRMLELQLKKDGKLTDTILKFRPGVYDLDEIEKALEKSDETTIQKTIDRMFKKKAPYSTKTPQG